MLLTTIASTLIFSAAVSAGGSSKKQDLGMLALDQLGIAHQFTRVEWYGLPGQRNTAAGLTWTEGETLEPVICYKGYPPNVNKLKVYIDGKLIKDLLKPVPNARFEPVTNAEVADKLSNPNVRDFEALHPGKYQKNNPLPFCYKIVMPDFMLPESYLTKKIIRDGKRMIRITVRPSFLGQRFSSPAFPIMLHRRFGAALIGEIEHELETERYEPEPEHPSLPAIRTEPSSSFDPVDWQQWHEFFLNNPGNQINYPHEYRDLMKYMHANEMRHRHEGTFAGTARLEPIAETGDGLDDLRDADVFNYESGGATRVFEVGSPQGPAAEVRVPREQGNINADFEEVEEIEEGEELQEPEAGQEDRQSPASSEDLRKVLEDLPAQSTAESRLQDDDLAGIAQLEAKSAIQEPKEELAAALDPESEGYVEQVNEMNAQLQSALNREEGKDDGIDEILNEMKTESKRKPKFRVFRRRKTE